MSMPARIEYSLRALAALAAAHPAAVNAPTLAGTQHIPASYLYTVLADLRRAGLLSTQRGNRGGYALTRPPHDVTLGGIVRLLDGPAPETHPQAHRDEHADPLTARLRELWSRAGEASLLLLDEVTLADLATGHLAGPH